MQTALACLPCFARQALEAARFVTDDAAVHERIVRDVLRAAAGMDLAACPPIIAQRIHRQLRRLAGVDDPYRPAKDRFTLLALGMLPGLAAKVRAAADALACALRLAIAGNVIDLGVNGDLTDEEVARAVDDAIDEPLHGDVEGFRQAAAAARDILYLTDNAGEIVFDRLLIEQLRPGRVTAVVRGGPVLNDATMADARAAGLCDMVETIDNGSDAPGTILTDCSDEFRERFAAADMIIAKGQGNFETLSDEPANVYFLFRAKCPVIADLVGLPVGTHAILAPRSESAAALGDSRMP